MNRALISTLNKQFEPYDGLAVAVSGGVDSSLLLAAACEYYGANNCLAVIAVSPSLGACELEAARSLCQQLDVELVELQSNEIENLAYVANDGTRCYWCKQELFKLAIPVAAQRSLPLAYGENYDDLKQPRAGRKSAEQNKILAPLREAKFTKEDVRMYARFLNLQVADKPAAPCLASRIAVGQAVSLDSLNIVASVETQLRELGYKVFRSRVIGTAELAFEFSDNELERAESQRLQLTELAASHHCQLLSIAAYRSGSVA